MKRAVLLVSACLLFGSAFAVAQQNGRLRVTVRTAAEAGIPAAPSEGAKVLVMHWTSPALHPTLVQDQACTTDQMGMCTLTLPPGIYDVFVSATGLGPAAFRREILAGQDTSLSAKLRSAPQRLRPVK